MRSPSAGTVAALSLAGLSVGLVLGFAAGAASARPNLLMRLRLRLAALTKTLILSCVRVPLGIWGWGWGWGWVWPARPPAHAVRCRMLPRRVPRGARAAKAGGQLTVSQPASPAGPGRARSDSWLAS